MASSKIELTSSKVDPRPSRDELTESRIELTASKVLMAESNLLMASSGNLVTDARPMLRSARADTRVGHRLRLIPQRRSQPPLDERQGHVLARVIVDHLVASDAAGREGTRPRLG